MRFDPNRLRVFLEAARSGGYTAAARKLHVTQSAVSHAIRKLEEEVGHSLVSWQGRRLGLTDEGAYLAEVAEGVFRELDEAARQLALREQGLRLTVTVGATTGFGPTVLVEKLYPLVAAKPWLHLDFLFQHELESALRADAVDIAVDCKPHLDPAIVGIPLFIERYVMVASPALLARQAIESPRDLDRVPLLSLDKEGLWWRDMLRALPPESRPSLRRLVAIDDVRGMGNAAAAGYGVALLPKYSVLAKIQRGALAVLLPSLPLPEDRFCVYQKRDFAHREKNRLVTEFLLGLEVSEFGDAIERTGQIRQEGR